MNLAAVLSLDNARFLNPLAASRAAVGGFSSSLQTLGNLGNVFTGIQSALGLLRGAVGPLGDAIRGAADFETLNAEFTVMLGNADRAQRMIAEIKSFAASTPFEIAGLAGSGRTLLAFGVEAENVLPVLRMLGDVAGASQEKLDSLTLAFAQVTSAGKLTGQDLLQMVNAGFNPLQEISRTTGRSMADLREEMEKGSISAAMVEAAFRSATSEGGRFFGNTSAQSRTFSGLLSTLRDAIADIYRAFGEPIILSLKPALEQAMGVASQLVPLARQLGEALGPLITGAASGAADLVRGLLGAFRAGELGTIFETALAGAARALMSNLTLGLSTAISVLGSALGGIFRSATALLSEPGFWGSIRSQVMSIVETVRAAVLRLAADVVSALPPAMRLGANPEGLRKAADEASLSAGFERRIAQEELATVDFTAVLSPMGDAASEAGATLRRAIGEFAATLTNIPEFASLRAKITAFAGNDGQKLPTVQELIDEERAALARDLTAAQGGTGRYAPVTDLKAAPSAAEARRDRPQVDALSRVGGILGGYNPLIAEQRRHASLTEKTNTLLSSIAEKLASPSTLTWA